MSNKPRTIAIGYGWAEGPWHGMRLAKELRARGYVVLDDVTSADIIFAHSAGCYEIPESAEARLVLLVGLPYAPAYHLAIGLMKKMFVEFNYHRDKHELGWWRDKLLHNGWYIVSRPGATYGLLTKSRVENLPSGKGRRIVMVRPRDDVFMPPDIAAALGGRGYEFITLEGSHDSCWSEPRAYVDLIAER